LVKLVRTEILAESLTFVVLLRAHETTHTVVVKRSRQSDERRDLLTVGATRLLDRRLEAISELIDLLLGDVTKSKV
jgi:hypothetical protein